MGIRFYSEDTTFDLHGGKRSVGAWMRESAAQEGAQIGSVNIIFCSDSYLLEMNRAYLQHDYLTDIITFDYSADGVLSGDLFISVDRVRADAPEYDAMFHVELLRVMIHGILHLMGYKDKAPKEEVQMRKKEDECLHSEQGKALQERLKGLR